MQVNNNKNWKYCGVHENNDYANGPRYYVILRYLYIDKLCDTFRPLYEYHGTVASLEGCCTGPRPGLNLAT